jgi:hypothetical protein
MVSSRVPVGLACLIACAVLSPAAFAAVSIAGTNGFSVSVEPSGSYDVISPNGWHFSGNIGQPLSNLASTTGIDANGHFSEIGFDFQTDAPRHAAIRAYWDKPAILFNHSVSAPVSNSFSFPSFTAYPKGLNHVAYSGTFATPTFTALPAESPWAFFDHQGNTFLISPAANFMVASLTRPSDSSLSSGIDSQISTLPAGFTHSTVVVASNGINRAFSVWGQVLTNVHGKTRPANDADATLARLGYWTDNGARYYYHPDPNLSFQDTLVAVKASVAKTGVALGYVQLDSWFYPKGPAADWSNSAYGFFEYEAAPVLFGSGLGAFQSQLGSPLVTHARWIDTSSPYRQQYRISGNVATDPAYWDYTATYLHNAGVATYEQDWLTGPALPDFNLTDPDAFLDNMAYAMSQHGLTMQYCMASPRHVMQGSKYTNLTTVRASLDRFTRDRWTAFLYASTFIHATGAYPFSDVFMSGETANLLLATLSAGPVGIGDPIGTFNSANLRAAARADGILVKPDAPILPIDPIYQTSAAAADAPMIAAASTTFSDLSAHYVFAYTQGKNATADFALDDLGISSPVYVYDYFQAAGAVQAPHTRITKPITGDDLYLVLAPIGPSGIAVIGDTSQFVTLGKKRIASLTDDGSVHLTVSFAAGETTRRIEGYSPRPVTVTASQGVASQVTYDASTHRFVVTVGPSASGTASIQIAHIAAGSASPSR